MATHLLRERYETLEIVGRGGEGEVSRALDQLHGRQVALKVRTVVDDASRSQLLSEAQVLLSLSPHRGLPLVREDFFVDDRYVIAMDWIEGRDLAAVLDADGHPGLDPELTIDYLEQAAEALDHLHLHRPTVVHGDVKPANLILTSSGRVALVDFGLSSRPYDDPRRAGTAGYVAPEVAAGERPSPASDVYSFAATALALLTGEPPTGGPPSWGDVDPGRIAALERSVRPSLSADPARRDPSATAFVARLRRWWGADLPSGTVTFVMIEAAAATAEELADGVARAHGGHCVAPADGGPLLTVFRSADDGIAAARVLAADGDGRVAAVTGVARPDDGGYRGALVSSAAQLLELAGPGQVLLDDATSAAIDGRLPPTIAFAELPGSASPTGASGWVLVAPDLAVPPIAAECPYRGLMSFGLEDGDVYFG